MPFPLSRFRPHFPVAGLASACLALGISVGEDAAVREFTPDEAIAVALANSPELAVAELEIDRAEARLRWSGRLGNPELELSAADDLIGLGDDERSLEIAFTQSFPLTSRLRDERDVRSAQVLLAEAEIAERRRQLAYEVAQTSATLQATRAKLTVADSLAALNSEIVDFLRPLVEIGEASTLDVTQAELTGRSLKQEITALQGRERQQSLELARLLGVDPHQRVTLRRGFELPLNRPAPAPLSDDELFRRRPDHLLTLAMRDVAEAEALLAHAERWDDISLKVFVEREQSVDEPDGLDANTFTGVGVSIPLPIRQRNEEAIELARIDLEAAERSRAAREFHIRSEYEAALQAARDAHALATEASGGVIELAQQNLGALRAAYEQGQASLLQVQRGQEQLLELQNASLDLVADYHLAEARLRFVTADYPALRAVSSRASGSK